MVAKSAQLYADHHSFVSVLVLSGEGIIADGVSHYSYRAGDSFFIPAASGAFSISGAIEALITTIPESPAA